MQKFSTIHSKGVVLPIENIDTDQIIPARFLKATTRDGFGDNLFRDWRFKNEALVTDFPLNQKKGEVLIAGKNFGCGSSREHAAWAIFDYGFKAVVSSFFADIFRNNALNNGLLPIQVSQEFLDRMISDSEQIDPDFTVDLELQELSYEKDGQKVQTHFDINNYKKHCLLNGLTDFDFLVSHKESIERFEHERV